MASYYQKKFVQLLSLVICFLISTTAFAQEKQTLVPPKQVRKAKPDHSNAFVKVAQAARFSIVTVTHLGRDGRKLGIGTGFIIDEAGLIATNLHVIGEARLIRVKFHDGTTATVESIQGIDRDADLAILKINLKELKKTDLKKITFGAAVQQGELVAAIGHPNGLKNTLVTGVVSGMQEIEGRELIQVSMPIDFGNSGGPLLNQKGEVLGIITYKSMSVASVGFAMPVADLKRLLDNLHPVAMKHWMTIGALDSELWQSDDTAMWRQRAGRIAVSGMGKGIGGRAICLWQQNPPSPQNYEVAVSVKLEDEAGAAGLVFQTDDQQRHYGFYPSKGNMRISRFDGADVFSWKVLKEISTPHYRAGEWNDLKVSVQGSSIKCFCNENLIFEFQDGTYTKGKVGLAKFRDTNASFRRFQVAKQIASSKLDKESANRLQLLIKEKKNTELLSAKMVEQLNQFSEKSKVNLEQAARELEKRAKLLRQLSQLAHEHRVSQMIVKQLKKKQPDLVTLSLLLAKFDNPEVEQQTYKNAIATLAVEIQKSIGSEVKNPEKRRQKFDRIFFQEFGFHGSTTNYYNKSNSYLNEVIDDREGLPISLSVLYIAIAQKLKLDIRGIGLPGHFVVQQYVNNKPAEVIDVFGKGTILKQAEMVSRVENQSGQKWRDDFLTPYATNDIFFRMVYNLKGIAEQKNDFDDIYRYVNLLVLIDSKQEAEHRFVRTILNIRSKQSQRVYADLDWLEKNAQDSIGTKQITKLRKFAEQTLPKDN